MPLTIVYDIAAWVLSIPVVLVFWKAGTFKLTAPIDTIAAAGIGWVKDTSKFVVRLVALLEVLGVVGLVLAHAAYYVQAWTLVWAIAAALGLSLTMLAAALLHIVRKEIKYTWKMNFGIAGAAAAAAGALVLVLLG